MGNRRNRRLRIVESQPPDGEKNFSVTSIVQGDAILTNDSENADNVFDRNLGRDLTAPSQVSNEIEVITQRLAEQNNTKVTQIEEQLNSKFAKILKEFRVNRNRNIIFDEEDAENSRPGPSYLGNRNLRKKHASNIEIDNNKNQDHRFQL